MIRIVFDVVTDTDEEARAILRHIADLGLEATSELEPPPTRPHLVALPAPREDAS